MGGSSVILLEDFEGGAGSQLIFQGSRWRRYQRAYLQASEAVSTARSDLDTYSDWYNRERVHSRIEEDRTPEQAYWALTPELAVGAQHANPVAP